MLKKIFNNRLPGRIATTLVILIAAFWSYWSVGEMYHEGWWGPWYMRLPYLVPGTVCLALTLIAITWPRLGGWSIILVGGAFTIFFLDFEIADGHLSINRDFRGFLVSGPLVLIGVLFLVEGRYKKQRMAQGGIPHPKWWRRNLGYLLAIAPPLLIFIGFSVYYFPIVFTRQDDGDRGARLIEGNGVTLIWAPEGPGWNWKQPWGGYPSWQRLALYGVPPVGLDDKPGYGRQEDGSFVYATAEDMAAINLCLYLSEDGLTLMDETQNIWRMPTTDEYIRSLARHGKNAGCVWNGEDWTQVACATLPDKESPLWAPDLAPIYYWTADEYDEQRGYFISYNGRVNVTFKTFGNPRHSYRCVRNP